MSENEIPEDEVSVDIAKAAVDSHVRNTKGAFADDHPVEPGERDAGVVLHHPPKADEVSEDTWCHVAEQWGYEPFPVTTATCSMSPINAHTGRLRPSARTTRRVIPSQLNWKVGQSHGRLPTTGYPVAWGLRYRSRKLCGEIQRFAHITRYVIIDDQEG